MPVRQYTPTKSAEHVRLVDELIREWSQPDGNTTEPVILEETGSRGADTRVYVVWSQWAGLGRDERGEMIMEAAERVKTPADLARITIVMGLVPDEADRLNMHWR